MEATVSSKGQVVIPQKIRQRLGITAGSAVDFVVQDNVLQLHVIRNKPCSLLADGHGMLKHSGRSMRKSLPPDFDVASTLAHARVARAKAETSATASVATSTRRQKK